MIKDRSGNIISSDESQDKQLNFLYKTALGRLLLKLLCRRFVSNIGRLYMESPLSKGRIKKLLAQGSIRIEDYEQQEYHSFNEFFIRKILKEKRPVDMSPEAVIAPADSKLTVYDITEDSTYRIKGCDYSIKTLLGNDDAVADEFVGGKCLIYRLTVDNYHRYSYPDNGTEVLSRFIPGILHTVNPIAYESVDVCGKNCRELTLLETENFGRVAYVEVGALMVGRINNHHRPSFSRGEEKGYFSFGGSTIVLLYKKDCINIDADIVENSRHDIETAVLVGEKVGSRA